MATGEPRPGSELPAPYRSPWRALAEALSAVSADLRLGGRRLWRRNLEGDLPRPGFWPIELAALFWPLLLALLVALVGAPVLLLRPLPGSDPAPAAADTPSLQEWSAGSPALESPGSSRLLESPPNASGTGAQAPDGRGDALHRPATGTAGPPPHAGPTSADTSAAAGPAAPELRLDPLLELLSEGDEARWLLAARPEPARGLLILTLSNAAEALPEPALLQRAEKWQQRARDMGYERLELRDSQGQLRGRQALVGSGMILLAPGPFA